MKKILTILLVCTLSVLLAGCQNKRMTENDDKSNLTQNSNAESFDDMKILVAYFSLAGEQYDVGVIKEGNTSIIAKMIAQETNADIFEIKAETPYPTKHDELLDIARKEKNQNARPNFVDTVDNMDDYDIVFVGYPNWWGDMPMIVYHFIESFDLSHKTVIPFCTHGGSGLSNTEETIAQITHANMLEGFSISGSTAQNEREEANYEVKEWLKDIGVTK